MAWMIYIISIADNVKCLMKILSIVLGAVTTLFFIFSGANYIESNDTHTHKIIMKYALRVVYMAVIPTILLATFLPSSSQVAAIYLVPKVLENQRVINVGDKAMSILEIKINEWLNNLSK